jgi:transcriptional regulator with XRE-family HTH domain
MDTLSVLLGQRIAAARRVRGWNKSDLARHGGVTPSYITKLEAGRIDRPSMEKIRALAGALGVRVTDLTDPPTADPDAALLDQIRTLVGTDEPLVRAIFADLAARTLEDRQSVLRFMADALKFKPATQSGMSRR